MGLNYGVDRAGIYDEPALELLRRISRPLSRSIQAMCLLGQTVDRERSAAALVSRSGDVACVVDDQLRFRDANPAAELEFRRQKLVTMRASCLCVTAPGINGWLSDTLRLLAAGLGPDATARIFLTDGSYQIGVVPLPKRVHLSTGARSFCLSCGICPSRPKPIRWTSSALPSV